MSLLPSKDLLTDFVSPQLAEQYLDSIKVCNAMVYQPRCRFTSHTCNHPCLVSAECWHTSTKFRDVREARCTVRDRVNVTAHE